MNQCLPAWKRVVGIRCDSHVAVGKCASLAPLLLCKESFKCTAPLLGVFFNQSVTLSKAGKGSSTGRISFLKKLEIAVEGGVGRMDRGCAECAVEIKQMDNRCPTAPLSCRGDFFNGVGRSSKTARSSPKQLYQKTRTSEIEAESAIVSSESSTKRLATVNLLE